MDMIDAENCLFRDWECAGVLQRRTPAFKAKQGATRCQSTASPCVYACHVLAPRRDGCEIGQADEACWCWWVQGNVGIQLPDQVKRFRQSVFKLEHKARERATKSGAGEGDEACSKGA